MKKSFLIALLFIAASYTASQAQTPAVMLSDKPGWHKIATRHANLRMDRDEIPVLFYDHFKAVKLRANDATVNLTSFQVFFENDSVQNIAANQTLYPGEETPETSLNQDLAIKKIVLAYKTMTTTAKENVRTGNDQEVERETERERGEIEIWGLK